MKACVFWVALSVFFIWNTDAGFLRDFWLVLLGMWISATVLELSKRGWI